MDYRYIYFYISLRQKLPSSTKHLHAKAVFWVHISHIQTSSASGEKEVIILIDFEGRFLALERIICPKLM